MKLVGCTTLFALLFCYAAPKEVTAADGGRVVYSFDQASDADLFKATATGESKKRKSEPKIVDGQLYLLESWEKSTNTVAFAAPADTTTRVVDVSFKLIMNTGTEGAGFAWLDVAKYGSEGEAPEVEKWEEPSIPAT